MNKLINYKSENHLIIIWSNALHIKNAVIKDLLKKYDILSVSKIIWDKNFFTKNLSRFYGEKLITPKLYKRWYSGHIFNNTSYKERQCGNEPFIAIIIRDNNPIYGTRKTSKGYENVNLNIFDLKIKYRKWSGGGHLIHTTNDIHESRHDMMLLFGESYKTIKNKYHKPWDGKVKTIKSNIIGNTGWKNLEELFLVLNETVRYLVLRNFEEYPLSIMNNENIDIDILTDSYLNISLIANSTQIYMNKKRSGNHVLVAGKKINFDFRHLGDNYYDLKWEKSLLVNRIKNKFFYIPSQIDYYYSLLYHALIHKKYISIKYYNRLEEISKKIEINFEKNESEFTLEKYLNILSNFMQKNNYKIRIPLDYSVFFNNSLFFKQNISLIRKVYWFYINLKFKIKKFRNFKIKLMLVPYYSQLIENYKSAIWLLKKYRSFKKKLSRKYAIQDITMFSFLSWHNGAYYFTGKSVKNNTTQKLFIKTDYFYRLMENEFNAYKFFSKIKMSNPFYPKVEINSYEPADCFIIYRYIDAKTLDKVDFSKLEDNQKLLIFDRLIELIKLFNKYRIIHRDIKPQNILISNRPYFNITIIDWMFSISKNKQFQTKELPLKGINRMIISNLGDKYRKDEFCWDDAYSMMKIFEELSIKGEKVDKYIFELSLMVGELDYSILK